MPRLALALSLAVLAAPHAAGQSRFDLHEVAWTLAPDPGGERIAMEMALEPLHDRDRLVLRIPLWRPGSYRYAGYQERISNLKAVDQEGREREILALDPRAWEVDTRGATALRVTYDLEVENQAPEGSMPSIRLHGPATFLYLEEALELPHTLRFRLPRGWGLASGHRPDPGDPALARSPGYDVFVDCPLALGALERHRFESHGKPFAVVLFGAVPDEERFDRQDWLRRVAAITDAAYDVVGEFPFERYLYLFFFTRRGGMYGLEHLNSTCIEVNPGFVGPGGLGSLESVTAHEFFHLWNVKRIRPEQLGPFDYASDVRTRDLWWLEGVTSYYADLILQRSGLRDGRDGWFWDAQARVYSGMRNAPGFGRVSPERSSWTVWDPDPSARISYYSQGQVLGFLLDLKIRIETGNRRSLDDVVRFLHRWVDYPDRGYRPGDLERAIRAVTGWDCSRFFDRHVSGLVDPPYAEVLPGAGLRLMDARPGDPYLGFSVDEAMVVSVAEESPAFGAGLRPGDVILDLDGGPVDSREDLWRRIAGLEPEGEVRIRIRRGGSPRELVVPVESHSRGWFRIEVDPQAPPAQRAIREGLLRGDPRAV